MNETIRQSWHAQPDEVVEQAPHQSLVSLVFTGIFADGSYQGTAFSGQIEYDRLTRPSERHVSFALYEDIADPVATICVGDKVFVAAGAAVYHSIFDGNDGHHDFLTMFSAGSAEGAADDGFVELYFADNDAATLDGTRLPSARRLCAFPVKQLTFGTSEPGNVPSVGAILLSIPA